MATSDQIVGAAVGLGEQKSWEAVRLHDVAAVLGISLDDVRAHFREKEDSSMPGSSEPIAPCSKLRRLPTLYI